MKKLYFACLLWAWVLPVLAQQNPVKQTYQLLTSNGMYKNFYLLSLMKQLPELSRTIQNDPVLKKTLSARIQQVNTALQNCKLDILCYTASIKFSDEEIKAVSERLKALYTHENVFGNLVKNDLLPSGCYGLLAEENHADFLAKAWEQDASAVNYAIGVYAEAKKPNYPKIDSISFKLQDKEFAELIATGTSLAIQQPKTLFFEPAVSFAMEALELNGRAEAYDYESMMSGVNKAALEQIKKTNWKNYAYSVILVPGAGPEDRETELSAGGMIRCRLAAIPYRKGLAPFIVVSGGRVHPYKTKYSEAFEMKKFMMETLHIPESAILMEPHARHTTTNFRNCARLMFRYGMPIEKPAMVSTTKSGIDYITSTLLQRSRKELGYAPYQNGKRLSDTEAEFYLNTLSLQIDFDEPLDP